MNKFNWYESKSIEDALEQVNSTVSKEIESPSGNASVFKAGGTDLLDLMKEGLVQPKTIVHIRNIPGLDKITYDRGGGLKLGANVTLAEIERDQEIKSRFQALHQAVAHAATPQIRSTATIGGNLAQRTRCWYFRSSDHPCLRKGGDRCFAKDGENENHAILNNGTCVSVHASSVSTALMAFDAKVMITNDKNEVKEIPLEEFFIGPGEDASTENILRDNEMITAITIPSPGNSTKSFYIKQGARESYDWSIADVAVVADMQGSTCNEARVVLGAIAPTPLRSRPAERVLKGKKLTAEVASRAAIAALERARPLSKNAYKIPLFESIIKEAITKIG
jgi:xanthine dehydrogenase YagS FAD-binding subunit